jgi:hypothetical protein
MPLRKQQSKFVRMLADLLDYAHARGYEFTLGDAYRDPRVHGELGVKKSYSSANSVHKLRLAIDLNLFKDGVFLYTTKDHEPLGVYWESIGGIWGGRFEENGGIADGNHYSLEYNGVK